MASETITSPNASSRLSPLSAAERRISVSEGGAKCARSANSSSSSDGGDGAGHRLPKRRNRSPDKSPEGGKYESSGSDAEHQTHDARPKRRHAPKKHQQPQQPPHPPTAKPASARGERRSGYSSSDESGAEEQAFGRARPSAAATQELHARRRKATSPASGLGAPTTPSAGGAVDGAEMAGWEVVNDDGNRGSDVCWTGNDSSDDDFWKVSADGGGPAPSPAKPRKPKRPESKGGSKSWSWPATEPLRSLAEWKWRMIWSELKTEQAEEVEMMRRMRDKCLLGFLLVFIFCGVGALVFHSVEGAFEMFYKCGVKRVKRDFLDTLWSKSHYMREDEWKSLARGKLMEFENQLYDAYEAGMNTYSGQKAWSFLNSFVYCITLITTIGYGHIAPATTLGRMITIVYSLFGIPLFLILLADYGKLFTRVIKFFWAYVRRLYYTGSCRSVRKTAPVQEVFKGVQLVIDFTKIRKLSTSKGLDSKLACPTSPTDTPALSTYTIDDEFNLPISVAVSILLLYMLSGAALFMKLEKWSFFESFYFVYISVSTIGFGDIVPSSKISVLLCSLVYFVFGLSLTSMCINVITEKLTDSFRQATAKIGATMGMEIAEEEVNEGQPTSKNAIIDTSE